ncbi:MAG: AtpZ/AtpI family protein [Anaerolineae bacterium]|nr:AtpZ/AtpI family protein [Anaerolineae bacterium]
MLVVLVALFLGLWLDQRLGQRGPATILVLILSVPVSLYLMTRLALGLVRRIEPTMQPEAKRSSLEKEE